MSTSDRQWLVVATAVAIFVSGLIHFYLYFRGGYRGIAPEEVLGITVSRAFALNAIAAVVIAEALVLALRYERLLIPACLGAVGFAAGTLVAYGLTRTTGFLGFSDDQTSTEAVIAVAAEVVAVITGTAVIVSSARRRSAAVAQ